MSWFKTALTHPQHAFNLGRRRIAVAFSHSLGSAINYHAAMPETINIYPTDRCNLKCNMCFQRLRSKHTELSIDAWINILNDISFKPRIHLSGGEPLIYPEFNELIARARAIGSFIAITTNGTLLEEHAKQLVDNKVNSITISIDGDEKTHDQIRGVPGTYQKLLAGLKTLQQVRLDKLVPEIHFNSMINFDQPEMMDSIINLAEQFKVQGVQFIHPLFLTPQDIDIHRAFIRTQLNCDLNYWQHADTDSWELPDRTVFEKLARSKRNKKIKVSIFPDFDEKHAADYYAHANEIKKIATADCRAMWNTATILPSGLLESCPDYVLGNCAEHKFQQLWNNTAMRDLRKRIKNRKYFSVCRACCFFY